jgi:hypothetical protein
VIVAGRGEVYERGMRNLILTVAVLAACGGPSGRDLAMAKQARYQGDKLQLFGGMKEAVEGKYKLEFSDETKLALKTIGRWYTPEGLVSNWTPEDARGTTDSTKRGIPDRSVSIALVAQLLPESDKWVVNVEPVILRYNEGQPKLEPVRPNDPSLPGFVNGKSDELAFEINKKLKAYEVKSVGGIAPAPTGPAPTPDEPKPAEGSAPAPAPAPEAGSGSAAPQ